MEFLSPVERQECYQFACSDAVIVRSRGTAATDDEKRQLVDQVIKAFEQQMADAPGIKPTRFHLLHRVKRNMEGNSFYDESGEEVYGFAILTIVLMALLEWGVKKLLDWLWAKWQEKHGA